MWIVLHPSHSVREKLKRERSHPRLNVALEPNLKDGYATVRGLLHKTAKIKMVVSGLLEENNNLLL